MASTKRRRGIGPQPVLVRIPGTDGLYFVREIEEEATTCRQCSKQKRTLFSYLDSVAGGFCKVKCFMTYDFIHHHTGIATDAQVRAFKARKANKAKQKTTKLQAKKAAA